MQGFAEHGWILGTGGDRRGPAGRGAVGNLHQRIRCAWRCADQVSSQNVTASASIRLPIYRQDNVKIILQISHQIQQKKSRPSSAFQSAPCR